MKKISKMVTKKCIVGITVIACIFGISVVADAGKKVIGNSFSTRKISIEKGKTYKLKYRKKNKYKSSNTKVASVSKKGVVRAKNCGKCNVKVIRNRKVIGNYSIKVINEKKEANTIVNTPETEEKANVNNNETAQAEIQATTAPGGILSLGCGEVLSCTDAGDGQYECVIDYKDTISDYNKKYFPDCDNIRYIVCKSSVNRQINSKVQIAVNYNSYKYTVKDNTKIELQAGYLFV